MSEKKEKEGEIKVEDKRRFDSEGKVREGDFPQEELEKDASRAEKRARPKEEAGGKEKEGAKSMPPIDFPTFILSVATSAQVHLGAVPNPATGKTERDLALAKQTIDILDILKEKTKGNLADEESRLLDHVLYDLHMKYVELKKN